MLKASPKASPLRLLHFDSAESDLDGEAFGGWREQLAPLFDVGLPDPDAAGGFHGVLTTYHMGTVLLARATASGQEFARDNRVIADSGADHFLVQLYLQGGYVGTTGPDEVTMRAGDVCVIDMGRTLKTRASSFDNVSLVVPRDVIAPMLGASDALHGLVLPASTAAGAMLGDHLLSLYRNIGELSAAEAPAIARGTVALAAGCLGPATAEREVVQPALQAARLAIIRRYIEKNLSEAELGADVICREFGVSRANLYRLFEPLGGVNAYIRERRLARAFVDLISPVRRRIGDVAYDWGFGSEASFSRAFRTAFGMSPRDVRAASSSLSTLLADSGFKATADTELGRWIRTLGGA